MARVITSPSAWTTKLITPWVEGCCGPMLSTISPCSACSRRSDARVMVIWSSDIASRSLRRLSGLGRGRGRWGRGGRRGLLRLHHPVQVLVQVQRVVADVRDALVPAGLRVVLPQRVPDPVLREQHPAQVRVAAELDAEEIEDLAL